MTQFIKVRSKSGPKHAYYVSTEQAAAHPEKYDVLDKEPREQPGRIEYEKAPAPRAPKKPSTRGAKKPAPQGRTSVGDTNEKEA